MGVSIRAYARARGCTEGAVRKAIATRRITTLPDGKIDPARANREWERNTFAGKTLHTASPTAAPVSAPVKRTATPQHVADVTSDPVSAYLRARAINETFKAKTAQLEYEAAAGKLIQATVAGEYAAHFSAVVGDALSSWPDRFTPLVAASTDEGVIHRLFSNEVAALRRKIAKAISDAGL